MQRVERKLRNAEKDKRHLEVQMPERCVKCGVLLDQMDYVNLCDVCFEQAYRRYERKKKEHQKLRLTVGELDDLCDPVG